MQPSHLLTLPLLCAVLAGGAQAQTPSVTQGLTSEIAPGQKPGTERWNVVFEQRSFDLSEFRNAVHNNATAQEVAAIVAGLEQKVVADQRGFAEDVESLGGSVVLQFWLINAATIEIPPANVAAVRALPNVSSVQPDYITYPLIKDATDANHHNADAEQAIGNVGTGVSVATIDTGLDSNHAGSGRPHRVFYVNGDINNTSGGGIGGSRLLLNVAVGAQSADDTHNHGTGVASINAGQDWGTANADEGHASNAGVVGISICEFAGSCGSTLAVEAAGWQRAAAERVQYNIVSANMSYGSSPSPTSVVQQAIDSAALNADIVAVTAAGNSSSSTAGSSSTANGLAVGACNNSKVMASFSSRGPLSGDSQRFFPDIAANGVSTVMAQRDNENTDWVASGTSMASPQVCGAAALVESARPCLNAREIKAILLAATESIAAQNPTRNRNSYGMGYLRDDLACNTARTPGSVVSDSLDSAANDTHTINVVNGDRVRIALVWFRHNLNSTAWSNLGLRVLNGATVVASNDDPRNLYEVVEFTAPLTGTLTVEVSSTSREIADVPYSLAFVNATSQDTALFTTFGAACAGSNGTPSLTFSGLPRVGESYEVNLTNAATNAASVLFVGFSNTTWGAGIPLPFDLTIIGGNGCTVYASSEILRNVTTDSSGRASVTLPTPCDSNFVGLPVYYQYIITDAVNGLGLVSSNGGEGMVGW